MTDTRPDSPRPLGERATISTLGARTLCAGLVSFAAVTGLLLGIGRRSGTPWRPLNAAGSILIHGRADDVWNFQLDVTPTGCLVVLVLSVMAGFVAACATPSRRTPYVVLASLCVATAGYLCHTYVAARTSGGLAALLSLGELRALYVTLAVALAVGIRLAPVAHEGSRQQVAG